MQILADLQKTFVDLKEALESLSVDNLKFLWICQFWKLTLGKGPSNPLIDPVFTDLTNNGQRVRISIGFQTIKDPYYQQTCIKIVDRIYTIHAINNQVSMKFGEFLASLLEDIYANFKQWATSKSLSVGTQRAI